MPGDQSLFPALKAACSSATAKKQRHTHSAYEKSLRAEQWLAEREPNADAKSDADH